MKHTFFRIIALLLLAALLVGVLPSAFAIGVNSPIQIGSTHYSSLKTAFDAANNGDVISMDYNVATTYTTSEPITVTKNVVLKTAEEFLTGTVCQIQYNGTSAPLFTVANGATLTLRYTKLSGNTSSALTAGGLIRVKSGGMLILEAENGKTTTLCNSKLTAQNSAGGAIYAEQGGKVIIHSAVFQNNSASSGNDLFAEQKSDITVDAGNSVNAAYGQGAEIVSAQMILSGEIGLVFHTRIPEAYRNGSFILSCRTGETVTYAIADCETDKNGNYLAKYNLKSVELSEPVKLSVCSKDGAVLTERSISAEQYGIDMLKEGSVATDAEKNIIRALLNYGHFAQISCSKHNGWSIGTGYAATAKYADLKTDMSVFKDYAAKWSGTDESITRTLLSLSLDYKTDIKLHFYATKKPAVTVDGKAAEVTLCEQGYYEAVIPCVSALDLAKEFTVTVNGKITIVLSALTYGNMAITQNDDDCRDTLKAMYEFYQSVLAYQSGGKTDWGETVWN